MIACRPDHETIHTALSLATRAPSINDSQPWLWRVGAQSLHLYADPDRGGLDTDPQSRDVLLSCGAALHHCVVALAALGWRAKVQRLPDPAEPGHVAALELSRHPAGALDAALASAIPRRRSDWRPYSPWPVSTADMALIGARAARAGVTTRRVETAELQHVVAQAVWRHTTPHGHAPKSDSTASMVSPPIADSEDDNAVVLALGTKDDSRLARLRAGEATSLVLLSATALGLASCPVAEPLETSEARDTVQANLFSIVGFPQMLLRIGWPPVDADSLPSPPRRPLTDVAEWLGHQSLTSA
ncbi:NAD(P)H nitroreductase [Mycobacterium sp.]|uniref:NAD(P)H nitroreductase n=1 Tax=Mycobacterium sp. TaxID=1785 RepID=UPI002BD69F75|nr:NAD(P)H nitroreductase [Mycobacterium sp.]HKP39553.1 NAD(P)H nitroreductase [Mycobacterium sp.]